MSSDAPTRRQIELATDPKAANADLPSPAGRRGLAQPEFAKAAGRAISIELRRAARKARTPRPVTTGGGGFRARRGDKIFKLGLWASFVLVALLPAVLSLLYYGWMAADQYVSEAQFTIRSPSGGVMEAIGGLGNLIPGGQEGEAYIVADYIESRAAVEDVSASVDLRTVLASEAADIVARFDPADPIEDLVDVWKSHVDVTVDRVSGLVTVGFRAFTAGESLAVTKAIVDAAEQMVNRLSSQAKSVRLAESERELQIAQNRLRASVAALSEARNREGLLDADLAAAGYGEVITALQLQLAQIEQTIDATTRGGAGNAPQLPVLRDRAESIRAQIRDYEAAVAGSGDGVSVASKAGSLQIEQLELEVARAEYAKAATGYEAARMETEQQSSYLLVFVPPRLAEDSLYPRRGLMILLITGAAGLIWLIIAGLAYLVRDYMAA